MRFIKHILNVLCLVLVAFSSLAQSESEIRKNADKLFEEEAYVQATPLYLRLLNLYPRDADLNFRYGTCSLFNDDKQKRDALKFLTAATQTPTVDIRAFYFKGKALHFDYQFDEAKKFYKIYLSKRSAKDDRYDVDREIEMCDNGKKLMIQFTDIIVSEKTQIEEDKFFRLYKDMQSIGGDILVTERFQSKIDKKKGHVPIVHYPKNAKAVYYSSYGDDDSRGLDIYMRKKLPDNSWGEPFRVLGDVNTEFDEDFPYIHPNGRYLYFSSKGHNSMGGFDIFLSRLNPETNAFERTENVDFAICSPDDDLFYVVDSAYQNAYFASARQSEQGKLHVYRVKVVRIPIQEIILMGDFASEINPDNKEMTINVTSTVTGSEIGKIATNQIGKYSFVFPKGGKYDLEIKIDGLEPVTKTIDLPFLDEFRPLKQKILHYLEDGNEKIKVVDLFDEKVEGGEELIAKVLREKSSLDVNINDFDMEALRKLELAAKRDELLAELGFQGMTIREVQNQLEELATADTKKASAVQKLNAGISEGIIGLADEIGILTTERDDLLTQANTETDPAKKYDLLVEAQKKDVERTKLMSQAQGLEDLSGEVQRKFGNDDPNESKLSVIEAEFNRLVEAGEEEKALDYLAMQKAEIEKSKSESTKGMVDKLVVETIEQRKRQDEIADRSKDNNREVEVAQTRKIELESKLPNAKKKDAERIEAEIAEIDNTVQLFQDEQEYNKKKISEITKDIAVLNTKIDVIQSSGQSVLKEIDSRKLADALAAINAQKMDDVGENLTAQIDQFEKENPNNVGTDPAFGTISESEKLINAHNSTEQEIAATAVTELEKTQDLLTHNEQTLNKVEQRLRVVANELDQNPGDEKLVAEEQALNEFKVDLENKQTVLANQLEELQPTVVPSLTREAVVTDLAPDYASTEKAIKSDLSISELERLRQLQENDEGLQTSAEERLSDIQTELETDPSNIDLLQELQLINDVLFDTDKSMKDRAVRIEQIENQTPDVAITKEDVIADLSPDYQTEIKGIQSNPALSEVEKLTAMNELDQTLETSIKKRTDKVEELLDLSPNNTELQGEQQVLEAILNDLSSGISARVKKIDALNANEAIPFDLNETIADVQPSYKTDMAAIDADESLSELEKLTKKQALDEQLVAGLNEELAAVENTRISDPNNRQLKIQEDGLKTSIDGIQGKVDERTQTINALNSVSSVIDIEATKQSVLDEVKSDYQDRLTEINESSKPEVARNLDRLELEQEILAALIEREKQAQLASDNNPSDQQMAAELTAVKQLIAEQQKAVAEQRAASLVAAKADQVYEETITEADKKYSIEIGDLTSESNPSAEKIAERERELQEKLQAALTKKQNSLNRKYSVDLDLESMILANEIEESKIREEAAANGTNIATTPEKSEQEFVTELREEFMSLESLELPTQNPSLEDAREHETKLRLYQSELGTKKSELENQLESSPEDENLLKQLSWVVEEEQAVEKALRRMVITIGELESSNVVAKTSTANDPELKALGTKRFNIETELLDPSLSPSELKDIDKRLAEVDQAVLKRTNDIQSEQAVVAQQKQDNLNNGLQQLGGTESESSSVKSAIVASQEERKAIDELLVQSDKAKSEEERQYLLAEAEERQEQLNARLERVIENQEIQNIEEQEAITLLSREELEKRKRGFIIEIGELEVQQSRVEDQIATAKRKDLPALNSEKSAIDAQLTLLKTQLGQIEARIEGFNETEPVDRIATVGLDQEITFSEERKIASSDAYKNYIDEGVKALEIENELRNFQQDLDREREELVQLIATPKSAQRDEEIGLKTARIKELETKVQELNREFDQQMSVADRLLPDDEEEAMKIKNLLVRGVRPIKTAVIATALIQMPSNGFAIDTASTTSIYTEANPIPVDVKSPSGLTYRVQIGAFSKPIPQDLFKEFNPVSGEKIGATGITRYMAGFFNSSETVVDARESIRGLGYSDAFVVAYCDGKRISFGEARRLEAAGECIPKGTNELVLEMAENTAVHMGIPLVNELVELPEYSYNQAPGAAKAAPIELKQGLFFTVQVGVYNRPVDDAQLKFLPEILTVRLPNGLIRYSTGMFDSVEDASPRKREANDKGISDAFIVAYYKGERLTMARARALLDEMGPSILQSNIEKVVPVEVVQIPENAQRTDSVTIKVVETNYATQQDERKVQIVTKKTFDEFPRDILNRYNTEGSFYFDESDGKVKSEIYSNKRDLPRLYKFEKDIDTVYLSEDEVQKELDKQHILVILPNDKVPGDLADWLLRMSYQKTFERTKKGLELHIKGIERNQLPNVQYRIREVGLEPILVEPIEEIIEDK